MPFDSLNSTGVRRLYSRQRGLNAAPIGGCFTVALGFARRGALGSLEYGPFAAYFVKLTSIIQDFESLHHRVSIKIMPSLNMEVSCPNARIMWPREHFIWRGKRYFFGMPIRCPIWGGTAKLACA